MVVGMMALFGGLARAPLAIMFMVGEMTGSYSMLAPAMIAVGISYVIVGRHTIYESQVGSPADSPAHIYEYSFPLLGKLKMRDAMEVGISPLNYSDTIDRVKKRLISDHVKPLPVVDRQTGSLLGIISFEDLLRIQVRNGEHVADFMTNEVVTAAVDDPLDRLMELLSQNDISALPVLENTDKGTTLVGMINRRDVSRTYSRAEKSLLDKKIVR